MPVEARSGTNLVFQCPCPQLFLLNLNLMLFHVVEAPFDWLSEKLTFSLAAPNDKENVCCDLICDETGTTDNHRLAQMTDHGSKVSRFSQIDSFPKLIEHSALSLLQLLFLQCSKMPDDCR